MDNNIIIDISEKKKYVITICGKKHRFYPAFSLRSHKELIETNENTNYHVQVAKALHVSLLHSNEEDTPSVEEIINDSTDVCQKYIEIVFSENEKLKEYFEILNDEKDIYKRFYLSVKKYDEYTLKRIQDTLKIVQQRLEDSRRALYDSIRKINYNFVFDNFSKTLIELRNRINESFKRLSFDLPKIDWESLDESFRYWGECGWTIIPNAHIDLYSIRIEDKSERDKYAMQYLQKKDIEELFADLSDARLNHKDLDEAIFCYNNKCYKACAMILCSLIDGRIYKRQPIVEGKRRKGNKQFFETIKKTGLEEHLLEQGFLLLQMDNLIAYLQKLFEQARDFTLKSDSLNRNLLLHGMNKRPVRKRDCIQLFLALYNVVDIMDGLNEKMKERKVSVSKLLK